MQDLNYSVPPARSAECLANALSHNNSKDVLCSQFLSITTTKSGPTATADVQQGALWAALNWTRLFILSLPWNVHRCFHTRIVLLCPALLHKLLQQIQYQQSLPLNRGQPRHFVAFLGQISP